jgi:hypothetical protein
MTGTIDRNWNQFLHVPPGTYTMRHSKPGYLVSPPAEQTVSVVRDPTDRYRLIVTPNNGIMSVVFNRWGTIEGVAHESGGSTPVAGAKVTVLESGATSTTTSGGGYRFSRACADTYHLKAVKTGYKRAYVDAVLSPAQVLRVDIPMSVTTKGYAVGSVIDEGGYPAINDPDATNDDPTIVVRNATGFSQTIRPHDGTFSIELEAGRYTFDFSAPGFISKNGVPVTITAGDETDATTDLELNMSNVQHRTAPERWVAPWTTHANWFGGQIPVLPGIFKAPVWNSYNIKTWNGLFRFKFDGDYQRVGLYDYIRRVNLKIIGEVWDWHYLYGVTPPPAPKVFTYQQDLFGAYDDRFEPPILAKEVTLGRTGVRVDGIDIVDQRDWSVVSHDRTQWNSCEELNGNLYTQFPPYSHSVPWNQQVVRMWLNIGRMDSDGSYFSERFGISDLFNQGDLFQAGGCNQLALYWRPTDNYLWVEPAIIGYPTQPDY